MSEEAHCDFTVTAQRWCPVIIAAAHAIYYHRRHMPASATEFEIREAREALADLNRAWAEIEKLYPATAPIEAAPEVAA